MPNIIVKTGPNCFRVKNKDSGKFHSKGCMTQKNAVAQLMILKRAEKKEGNPHGGERRKM